MKSGDYKEFLHLLTELKESKAWQDMGLLNADLARMLGVSERTLYRYLSSDTSIPLTVIILLRFMLKKNKGRYDELA
jgi:predicted transcriptional regulator